MAVVPVAARVCCVLLFSFAGFCGRCDAAQTSDVEEWLKGVDDDVRNGSRQMTSYEWTFFTDVTEGNRNVTEESMKAFKDYLALVAEQASSLTYDGDDVSIATQLKLWKSGVLTNSSADQMSSAWLQIVQLYSQGVYHPHRTFGVSDDFHTLVKAWKSWHDDLNQSGLRSLYEQSTNTPASVDQVITEIDDDVVSRVMTLYRQLHAYVRAELKNTYGPHRLPSTGHIPAQFVDGVDGVSWHRLYHAVLPYKFAQRKLLPSQVQNVSRMVQMADEFYQSLGYLPLPQSFWEKSLLTVHINDSSVRVCHPSRVWNFQDELDFRITSCLDVSHVSMRSAVELVGGVVAQRSQLAQPFILQQDPDSDYVAAAVSGALSLAFMSSAHLREMGLLRSPASSTTEDEINFLMEVALDCLPPLARYHVISKWQTTVAEAPTDKWNSQWWRLRCTVEGVSSPISRKETDFDAGSSTDLLQNIPGDRLLWGAVAQFQILKSLCQTAGHKGALSTCNLHGSTAVGDKLREVLSQGRLLSATEKLYRLTGSRSLDVTAMTEYFQPLTSWLTERPAGTDAQWTAACPDPDTGKVRDRKAVQAFLDRYDREAAKVYNQNSHVFWNFATNITDFNQQETVKSMISTSQFTKQYARESAMFDVDHVQNETQRIMLKAVGNIGTDALRNENKLKRLKQVQAEMAEIYNTAEVCFPEGSCLKLDPDLTQLMAKSRNHTELSWAWELWRNATGRQLKDLYQEFVQLGKEGVQELGYADMGQYWRKVYHDDNFQEELEALLEQLLPLYQQLHTYVRKRLKDVYGEENFPVTGHIPAHLLGNMWAQEWNNIYDLLVPFPDKENVDVTDEMVRQNWTVEKMFRTSEEFFTSLGLSPLPPQFWNTSMLEKPSDGRDVVCHASAWDFLIGQDFRIKMCTIISMQDLITVHHEMGHVQYSMQYRHLPVLFRDGANPGFHEAIGDTMALSVATPEHLHKLGLLSSLQQDNEADVNFLLKMALEKIAFLPFGYLIDQWRWSVFSGDTTPPHYNDKWWRLRCKLQGVSPPMVRTSDDFDPGAKFHVPDNTPYIRYFISSVLQFTFYRRLCEAANHTGPLHHCDFYQSQQAGAVFREMLQKGSSEPWQDVLEAFNGQRSIDASAILAYFQPLTDWLTRQNEGESQGWTDHCPPGSAEKIRDETLARAWLHKHDQESKHIYSEYAETVWNYATNLTDDNQQQQVESALLVSKWSRKKAAEVKHYDWEHFADDSIARQFRFAADIGTAAFEDEAKLKELKEVMAIMEKIYSTAKVHNPKTGQTLSLEPGLEGIMASSRDYDELLAAWKGWRDATGPVMKKEYEKFVAFSNEALQTLGYADTGDNWRSKYGSETFEADTEALLEQLSPLYTQLHAYVRRKLVEKYGANRFPYSGHIPAHLLGNMWAQNWGNLFDFLQPFPNKSALDITPELQRQGYTVEKMMTTAEEFFLSLGLEPLPLSFWNKSMLQRPPDGREVICHASAWNFYNSKDFRIKMCTDISMTDLITIHHELGHIQYYLQYKNQPVVFQSGANPGFHEAIGDTLALSVSTPKHLKALQLLERVEDDPEADLNFLLKMALQKIAFLPFGYLIDQWRWSVFSGDTTPPHYNDKWWRLRCKYQGISSPVPRNSTDFDPGAKYHVPNNTPYIRYFVSHVLQFQFYKALCEASGHNGSLHTCDFHHSKEAGQRLSNMLKLGSSRPWPDAMEQMTGTRHMDVGPLLEYFKPLHDWLKEQNAGHPIGWTEECPRDDLMRAAHWLEDYNERLGELRSKSAYDAWAYETNITDETSAVAVQSRVKLAAFRKEGAREAEQLQWRNLSDVTIRRLFHRVTNIGPSAMKDAAKFERMQTLQSQMEGIYGTAKVCLDGESECLGLEPGLEGILARERDHDRLLAVWEGWRNATGRPMKPLFQQFVALSNEGARDAGYTDTGEYWRSLYESPTFREDLQSLMEQLSPLYRQLHGYVRRRLMDVYGEERFPESGHIPAHLLGNMWAQKWNNIYDLVMPYSNRTAIDITATMRSQNYTVEGMFRTAEAFFSSLGFEPLMDSFWNGSILEKPADREIVCHASAWDFSTAKDFRVKMCTSVDHEDLVTVHHELGHIQYYMQYRHLPHLFRTGANPGFHEAIGDTIVLSASTPDHLRKLNLLSEGEDNYLDEINFLLKMALQKIAFLPFGYLIDQWRWSVFSGDTTPPHYNDKWWRLRCRYQGVSPPAPRSADDFDPGAKFHIPANVPYMKYFAAYVLRFQFHQGLCKAAGHTGPLHRCDIFQSEAAGKLLRSVLSKGASQPWPDVLEEMTGYRKLDAGPILDYFRPLWHWLQRQNQHERLGWAWACPGEGEVPKASRRQYAVQKSGETTASNSVQSVAETPRADKKSNSSSARRISAQSDFALVFLLLVCLALCGLVQL
ncbi:uncharacterized protein LOC143290570 isoform X2 [Babylonia areolata]|uniref:uncharacterized protein LOC143290570 isoform X2 n=1 Tax=Babylonia areolata TaxID=304850 RepID=UPI003FD3A463